MSIRIKDFPVASAVLSRAVVCVVDALRGSWVIVREPFMTFIKCTGRPDACASVPRVVLRPPRRHHRDSGDRTERRQRLARVMVAEAARLLGGS